jgi:hypothetical protein
VHAASHARAVEAAANLKALQQEEIRQPKSVTDIALESHQHGNGGPLKSRKSQKSAKAQSRRYAPESNCGVDLEAHNWPDSWENLLYRCLRLSPVLLTG